jgi:hypothetical protein
MTFNNWSFLDNSFDAYVSEIASKDARIMLDVQMIKNQLNCGHRHGIHEPNGQCLVNGCKCKVNINQ